MGTPRDGTSRATTPQTQGLPDQGHSAGWAGGSAGGSGAPAPHRAPPPGPGLTGRASPGRDGVTGASPAPTPVRDEENNGKEGDGVKEPIPAALNHPRPAPRSPPFCGRRGGGTAGGRVAGGTTASPPGGGPSSPALAQPVVSPGSPFPVPLARPLRVSAAARAAVMAASRAGGGAACRAEPLSDLPGSASPSPLPLRPGRGGRRKRPSAVGLYGAIAPGGAVGVPGRPEAAEPGGGGAVSRVSARARAAALAAPARGWVRGRPTAAAAATAAVSALGAPSPRQCVTDIPGVACNSLI